MAKLTKRYRPAMRVQPTLSAASEVEQYLSRSRAAIACREECLRTAFGRLGQLSPLCANSGHSQIECYGTVQATDKLCVVLLSVGGAASRQRSLNFDDLVIDAAARSATASGLAANALVVRNSAHTGLGTMPQTLPRCRGHQRCSAKLETRTQQSPRRVGRSSQYWHSAYAAP